jgi:hypothetical protein
MKIFLTSFFQIGLVAINTFFITKMNLIGIFAASFLISLLWAYNVGKIAIATSNQKLTYALGAGIGAISGITLVTIIFK